MYQADTPNHLRFPIKFNSQFLISGSLVLALIAIILPSHASAFWPFSVNAGAAVHTFISDSETPALVAATNSDPNPNKGLGGIQTSGGRALLASAGPSGTIAEVINSTSPGSISVHEVSAGETLSDIASMFGVSVNTIIWANNLSGAKDIHPGNILIILPVSGIKHTVVKGDTLKSLAKKYGGDANEIAQFNGLDFAMPLKIGSVIIIPGGEIVAPPPRARSSSTPRMGGGGSFVAGYYSNPLPGGVITQGIHGWNGVDIGAARGTPIHAAANGTVIIARGNGAWNGGYGNYVVVKHANGTQTLYSHMKSAIVSPGQSVTSGQTIGYVGATGRATGPHLHFEVRNATNPFRNCSVGRVCSPQ